MYTVWVYILLVVIRGAGSFFIFSFKPRPLYSPLLLISKLCGLNILFVFFFGQVEKHRWESKQSFSVLYPVACPLNTLCYPVSLC